LLHGFHHVDYSAVSKEAASKHLTKGKEILNSFFSGQDHGFRAPYLRYSEEIRDLLIKDNFLFDSSRTIFVSNESVKIGPHDRAILQRLYSPEPFEKKLSLPFDDAGLLEIPVTLPDDEILIDRLKIRDKNKIFQIFQNISDKIFADQEAYIMQLHPERIPFLYDPLREFLAGLARRNIWITDLLNLARWQKKTMPVFYRIDENKQEIRYNHLSGRKVLGRNLSFEVQDDMIRFQSELLPVIFAGSGNDPKLYQSLERDGFFVTGSEDLKNKCSHIISGESSFDAMRYRKLRKALMLTGRPLLFCSRWPEGKNGVFCLSGDIDALTIGDFFSRFKHFSGDK
ncbi:MAG: hypothetical protein JW928_02660, partial [Candidatus Aureabacteria bacterium]|nr:hypothetical protein [Candidatus Auribacterota bacterium]